MVLSGVFASQTPSLPLTASHEGAGTVIATGLSVTTFAPGDRIMVGLPLHPCGACPDCRGPETHRQYCARVAGHVGVMVHGCFAHYVVCDARSSSLLPDKVSFASAAPLACAGRTIWRGIEQCGLKSGEWIALVGAGGGLGHLGVQFAKARGLEVVGIDARDEGVALAGEAGADVVVDARMGKEGVVERVKGVTGGRGVDAAVVISDAATATGLACAVTKMHGTVIQIAQPESVVVPFQELVFRDVRIRGSLVASPDESRRMLECVAEKGIKVKTNPFYGLDKIGELTELVHGGKIQGKAIIVVDQEQMEREKELGAKF